VHRENILLFKVSFEANRLNGFVRFDWLISSTVLLALQLEPACIFTILTASPTLESVLVSSPGFVSLSDSKYFTLILENAESESLQRYSYFLVCFGEVESFWQVREGRPCVAALWRGALEPSF
jgi:hypothetical protein